MRRPGLLIGLILTSVLFNSLCLVTASSQSVSGGLVPNQLILNVYIDESGRCLVNGYVKDPGSLPFLNSSEYSYEEDSRQLYAITNALTSKSADNWSVRLESKGVYEEYRIIFYLPADAKLTGVDYSQNMDYLVYAANKTVVAEVHGHDITDPAVDIGYALQLADERVGMANTSNAAGSGGGTGGLNQGPYPPPPPPPPRRSISGGPESFSAADEILMRTTSSGQRGSGNNSEQDSEHKGQAEFKQNEADRVGIRAGVEMTGDLAAVMATLTDKEQSIIKGLLQRGGRMTQRDISRETEISKSSLSGILTSMEKRKLIIKREKGRMNIIELSERFTNNKERS